MNLYMYLCTLVSTFLSFADPIESSCKNRLSKNPLIAAILDLHTGDGCDIVNYYAVQQLAAIVSSVRNVNSNLQKQQFQIELLTFDSCSSIDGTKLATLQALVASQQNCFHTPLLLGFIGNENKGSFDLSVRITKSFNVSHIIPYSHSEWTLQDNIYWISHYPVVHHTQAVEILLKKLGLRKINILHDNAETSILKTKDINNLKGFCFSQTSFNKEEDVWNINKTSFKEDGLLIVIKNPASLEILSKFLQNYDKSIIISIEKIGLQNWAAFLKNSVYIVVMSSKRPLENLVQYHDADLMKQVEEQRLSRCFDSYLRREDQYKKCNTTKNGTVLNDQDWTAPLLKKSISLISSGLQSAYNLKCSNGGICSKLNTIPQDQWNNLLKKEISRLKNDSEPKNVNTDAKFRIYFIEDNKPIEIGEIENMELKITAGYKFLPLQTEDNPLPMPCNESVPIILEPTEKPTIIITSTNKSFTFFDLFELDIRSFELIGFLSGVVTGILLFMFTLFYIVYKVFSIKSDKSQHSNYSQSSN